MFRPADRRRTPAALVTALALSCATLPQFVASTAHAAPEDSSASTVDEGPKVAILPIVVEGEMPDADRTKLSTELVEGLQRGSFGIVTPEEVIAANGDGDCSKAGCMKKIGDSTGATHIVRATIEVVDRDYTVSVTLFDGRDGRTVISTDDGCEICGVADLGGLLQTQAATLRTKLDALASGPATVILTSNPEDAQVTIDGEVFGTTPLDKPIVPGEHVIRVSKDGYIAVQEKRMFVEGARENLDYELEKVPSRLPKRPWGWASLGVGLVAIAGAGVTASVVHGKLDNKFGNYCDKPDGEGDCPSLWDTMGISLPLGIVGGALTTLGVAVLINTAKNPRKKAKLEAAAARLQVGPGGIGVRF